MKVKIDYMVNVSLLCYNELAFYFVLRGGERVWLKNGVIFTQESLPESKLMVIVWMLNMLLVKGTPMPTTCK